MSKIPKNNLNGWLVIDKPLNITSTDVGRQIKRLLRPVKIGHVGTLDPLASGVLIMALGEATKLIPYLTKVHKVYKFHITFGESRSTDDAEGVVTGTVDVQPTSDTIINCLNAFVGHIEQVPPNYSAIQVNGVRSYDRARGGEDFVLPSRMVRIHELNYDGRIDATSHAFTVVCETGTYVRSLARDIAQKLGTLGYVSYLRRTCDGPFDEQDAIPLAKLLELSYDQESLLPLSSGLDDILAVTVRDEDIKRLYNGGPIALSTLANCPKQLTEQQTVRIYYKEHLCGMGVCEDGYIQPKRILHIGINDVDYN